MHQHPRKTSRELQSLPELLIEVYVACSHSRSAPFPMLVLIAMSSSLSSLTVTESLATLFWHAVIFTPQPRKAKAKRRARASSSCSGPFQADRAHLAPSRGTLEVPPQDMITRDNVTIKVNAVVGPYVGRSRCCGPIEGRPTTSTRHQQLAPAPPSRTVLGEVELNQIDRGPPRQLDAPHPVHHGSAHHEPSGVKLRGPSGVKDVDLPDRCSALWPGARPEAGSASGAPRSFTPREASWPHRRIGGCGQADKTARQIAVQLRYLQTLTEIDIKKNTTIVFPLPDQGTARRPEQIWPLQLPSRRRPNRPPTGLIHPQHLHAPVLAIYPGPQQQIFVAAVVDRKISRRPPKPPCPILSTSFCRKGAGSRKCRDPAVVVGSVRLAVQTAEIEVSKSLL